MAPYLVNFAAAASPNTLQLGVPVATHHDNVLILPHTPFWLLLLLLPLLLLHLMLLPLLLWLTSLLLQVLLLLHLLWLMTCPVPLARLLQLCLLLQLLLLLLLHGRWYCGCNLSLWVL